MNVHLKIVVSQWILVFKTNILSRQDVDRLHSFLAGQAGIRRWNVDRHDRDHVLRIVTDRLQVRDVERIVQAAGFYCKELPD